ncbi:MAG: methylmalonyl Co-A mutase-associated GTPase MeaB, partial [Ignavibacteriae bacterium]|nr:methylmalonyl Co-A mutase-associated GTPase MeaB [Ignavibacteriota bacterium]
KKGIIEISDALVFNKADGSNKQKANIAKVEFANAVHYLQPYAKDWQVRVLTASALTGDGIDKIWEMISEFIKLSKTNNSFIEERKKQSLQWMHSLIEESLKNSFFNNPDVKKDLKEIEKQIISEKILPTVAADILLKRFNN